LAIPLSLSFVTDEDRVLLFGVEKKEGKPGPRLRDGTVVCLYESSRNPCSVVGPRSQAFTRILESDYDRPSQCSNAAAILQSKLYLVVLFVERMLQEVIN